ncbi:MAG: filamentous hemagglutinin N-terminal domain-containing protein (plasmid) [Leptolyngbya sp. BL-A-14]
MSTRWHYKDQHRGRLLNVLLASGLLSQILVGLGLPSPAIAQVTPDNSLGIEKSVVTPDVINGLPSDRITGGAVRGTNLFHSFQQFLIKDGQRAYFDPGTNIVNIFSRITGGSRVDILGTLGVLSNANLYLISPNGILFGPNARLDLKGSFVASTASGVNFADGSQYNATNQDSPLLTIATPIGLQFGQAPGGISIQKADLKVLPAQTLALVGGDLTFEGGNVSASGGRIEIGSVAGNSQVQLNSVPNGLSLGFSGVENFQNVTVTQGARISAEAPNGALTITSKQLTVDGSQIFTTAFGVGDAGPLTVRTTELVELRGKTPDGQFRSGLFSNVNPGAEGKGGDLLVETKRLVVRDEALINGATFSKGNAGNVTIRASESIDVSRSGSIIAGVELGAEGDGGSLTIETRKLSIDNAQVSTSTFGVGNAGDLTIRASESVNLKFGGLFAQVLSTSGKQGGNLNIFTNKLEAFNGSVISVSSLGLGTAGNLNINARSINLRRSQILAETASGNGGNINLNIKDFLLMTRGSRISTTAGTINAGGNGGNITINSNFVIATPRASNTITANAFDGNGGKVSITARGIFGFLDGVQKSPKSFISASSARGIAGELNVTTLDLNPSRSVVELPSTVIDSSRLISRNCQSGRRSASQGRFVIKEEPPKSVPNPGEVLALSEARSDQIIEAQGLTRLGKNGEWVVFKAANTPENVTSISAASTRCHED